ncbi:MAG TPA: hypothetical protein VL992_03505 [Tepidisphaeraceae bacterium]|nr:hypothetical protein [Tepidisphaeraceae bacterium]
MKEKKLWIAVILVQAAVIIGMAYGPGATPARAEIPDAGAQNAQIIQLLSDNNSKLDHIIDLLQGGNIQVKVAKDDDK